MSIVKTRNMLFRLPTKDANVFTICLALKGQTMQEVMRDTVANYIKECMKEYGDVTLESLFEKSK